MDTPENNKPDEDEISLIDLLAVLIKHRWMIIITTFLSAVAVLAYSIGSLMLPNEKSYYPNYYTPKSILSVNENASGSFSVDPEVSGLAALAGISTSSGPSIAGVANKYMMSNSFIDLLVEEFNLLEVYELFDSKYPKSDSRKIVRENLSLEDDSDSGTIEISYKDIYKELATDIVNRVIVILEQKLNEMSMDENVIQRDILELNLASVKEKIDSAAGNMQDLQEKYGVYDMELFAMSQAETLASLQARLLEKEMAINAYKTYSSIEDPSIKRLQAERDGLEANIGKLKKGYTTGDFIIPSERELPELVREYKEVSTELELQTKIYASLVQQYELVKLQTLSIPPNFIVYEKAEIPEMKSGPSRGKLSIIVTMAMFFLSIFMAFILEFIGNIRKDTVEMDKLTSTFRKKTLKRKIGRKQQ